MLNQNKNASTIDKIVAEGSSYRDKKLNHQNFHEKLNDTYFA